MPRKKHSTETRLSRFFVKLRLSRPKVVPLRKSAGELQITPITYYRWWKRYGGLKMDQAQEAQRPRKENAQLKKLVADLVSG